MVDRNVRAPGGAWTFGVSCLGAVILIGCTKEGPSPPTSSSDLVTWRGSPVHVDANYFDLWFDSLSESRQLLAFGKAESESSAIQSPVIAVSEEESRIDVSVSDTHGSMVFIRFSSETGMITAVGLTRENADGSRSAAFDTDLDGVFDLHDTRSRREE